MPVPTPPHQPADEPAQWVAQPAAHWGPPDIDLLDDRARYAHYSAAHHVAGHHWARHRLGLKPRAAGLGLGADGTLPLWQRETGAAIEGAAVVIEALAIEAIVSGLHEAQALGADGLPGLEAFVDFDWNSVAEHVLAVRHDALVRGCAVGGVRVAALVETETWVDVTGRKALRSWSGIVALADALGHGRVLEADEVAALLGAP